MIPALENATKNVGCALTRPFDAINELTFIGSGLIAAYETYIAVASNEPATTKEKARDIALISFAAMLGAAYAKTLTDASFKSCGYKR